MAKSRKKVEGGATASSAPQAGGDSSVAVLDPDRIATRAYELYLARGGSDGQAMDDWLNAERELANGRPVAGTNRG